MGEEIFHVYKASELARLWKRIIDEEEKIKSQVWYWYKTIRIYHKLLGENGVITLVPGSPDELEWATVTSWGLKQSKPKVPPIVLSHHSFKQIK